MRYTKKPVTIEAIRFVSLTELGDPYFDLTPNGGTLPDWLIEAIAGPEESPGSIWVQHPPMLARQEAPYLCIGTLEGNHRANPGDWIIRGVQGELYPCKSDIFEATYDVTAPDCPRLEAFHESGVALLDQPGTFTIGHGFGTVADSDGSDGA